MHNSQQIGLLAGRTLLLGRHTKPLPDMGDGDSGPINDSLTARQLGILEDRLSDVGCTQTSNLTTHGCLISPHSFLLTLPAFLATLVSLGRRRRRKITVVTGLHRLSNSSVRFLSAAEVVWIMLHEFSNPLGAKPPSIDEVFHLCDGVVEVVTPEWLFTTLGTCVVAAVTPYLLQTSPTPPATLAGVSSNRLHTGTTIPTPQPPIQHLATQYSETPALTNTFPLDAGSLGDERSHNQDPHQWWNPPGFLSMPPTNDLQPHSSPFYDYAVYINNAGPHSDAFPQSCRVPSTGGFFPVFFGGHKDMCVDGRPSAGAVRSVFMSEGMKRQLDYIDRKQVFAVQKDVGRDIVDDGDGVLTSSSSPSTRAEKDALGKTNEDIVDELAKLKSVYEATGDQWRKYAYNRAIGVIKRWPTRIQSANELRNCQGIGDKILVKIDEIIKCGTTNKLTYLRGQTYIQSSEELVKVWGISSATAKRISTIPFHRLEKAIQLLASSTTSPSSPIPPAREYAYTTVDDVRRWPPTFLNPQQRAGLRYFEDLLVRIPRSEVEAIRGVVMGALRRLGVRVNPNTETTMRGTNNPGSDTTGADGVDLLVCGSYRRGKTSSGDVDVLICDRSGRHCDGLLKLLVEEMRKGVPALDDAAPPNTDNGHDSKKPVKGAPLPQSARERFVIGELTVSYKSSHESSADTWFGLVQVPLCTGGADGGCPCGHRQYSLPTVLPLPPPPNVIGIKTSFNGPPPLLPQLGIKRSRSPDIQVNMVNSRDRTDGEGCPIGSGGGAVLKGGCKGEGYSDVDSDGVECIGEGPLPSTSSMGALDISDPILPFCDGPHYVRRLDIKVYGADHFPFAVLYFTGSDYFNRSMRLYAQKRGMSLSDKGLTHVVRATTGKKEKIHEGLSEVCVTEREVFDRLGLPYRRPYERDL